MPGVSIPSREWSLLRHCADQFFEAQQPVSIPSREWSLLRRNTGGLRPSDREVSIPSREWSLLRPPRAAPAIALPVSIPSREWSLLRLTLTERFRLFLIRFNP